MDHHAYLRTLTEDLLGWHEEVHREMQVAVHIGVLAAEAGEVLDEPLKGVGLATGRESGTDGEPLPFQVRMHVP